MNDDVRLKALGTVANFNPTCESDGAGCTLKATFTATWSAVEDIDIPGIQMFVNGSHHVGNLIPGLKVGHDNDGDGIIDSYSQDFAWEDDFGTATCGATYEVEVRVRFVIPYVKTAKDNNVVCPDMPGPDPVP